MNVTYTPLPHPFDDHHVGSDGTIVSYRVSKHGRLRRPGTGRDGYARVMITPRERGEVLEPTTFYIHRLVAKAHLPNPDNLTDVDHINGIKTDNRVCNLRWCSRKQSLRFARERHGAWSTGHPGKPVLAIPVDGVSPAQEWPSARAWARASGNLNRAANVSTAILTGRSAYGFYWRFKDAETTGHEASQSVTQTAEDQPLLP